MSEFSKKLLSPKAGYNQHTSQIQLYTTYFQEGGKLNGF